MTRRSASRLSPLPALAGALVLAGGVGLLRDGNASAGGPCDRGEVECGAGAAAVAASPPVADADAPPVLRANETCHDVGYLCAELSNSDRIRLRRWKDFSGTIVVHVPRPDFEDPSEAARLQEAAARGIRAWNRQPFAILADLRGDRSPHFSVRWAPSLPANQIGVARTRWSSDSGLSVLSIELSTRTPYEPGRIVDVRQVQLTAAHEMGHALGLPHSDSERDVMYPTNTATAMSAQDYRTMEVLYSLRNGTEIVR